MAGLLSRRLISLGPVVELALALRSAAGVEVAGQAEHNALIKSYVEACWVWGHTHGLEEMERFNRRRFNDPPKPDGTGLTPVEAIRWAEQRTALQGNWQRALDAQVTQVIVSGLETGATNKDVMGALTRVFPTFAKARLENIARTESVSAYNQGRLTAFKSNSLVVAVQFAAILDSRTTKICRARDGMIMRMEDERLPSNTPPLHFMCRSTLVPVDRFDFEDLQSGVAEVEKQYFGWVGKDGPQSLVQATSAWDETPRPLPGFGSVRDIGKKESAPVAIVAAPPVPLKDKVQDAVTNSGSVLPASVTHADLTRAGEVVAREILARYDWDKMKTKPAKEASAEWAQAVKAVISEIRPTGNVTGLKFASGSNRKAKDLVQGSIDLLPTDWGNLLKKSTERVEMKAVSISSRASFRPGKLSLRDDPAVALHETGHWLESLGLNTIGPAAGGARVFGQAMAFLRERTQGERLQTLRSLTGIRYASHEVTRKDNFSDPYVGKDYGGRATEITSMGLEALFYRRHEMWEKDPEMIHFILGMLSWL